MRFLAVCAAVCAALLVSVSCQSIPQRQQYEYQGRAMGTSFSVKVVTRGLPETEVAAINSTIEDVLSAVNAKMSTYLDTSELSRINRHDSGDPMEVSPEMLEVLVSARQIGIATNGAFDITVGPVVNAWGFGPKGRPGKPPTDEELDRLAGLTGWDEIEIDDAGSRIRKTSPEAGCDLAGIAKGFGVDQVSEALSDGGYSDHMVEVGGEVRVSGRNSSGEPWRIAVERPATAGRTIHRVLALSDQAMATSGDYRNFFEENGVRYSHIIDPRTLRPIRHRTASVSVVDQFCMQADGFATALLVLGENEGYEMAVAQNLAALFLIREADGDFTEKATPRFVTLFGEAGDDE